MEENVEVQNYTATLHEQEHHHHHHRNHHRRHTKTVTRLFSKDSLNGKLEWKRIPTRQWIHDFKDYMFTFYNGERTCCKLFHLTSGYYPDLVDPESYEKYQAKCQIGGKRHSRDSGATHHSAENDPSDLESDLTATVTSLSSQAPSTTDSRPVYFPPTKQKVDQEEDVSALITPTSSQTTADEQPLPPPQPVKRAKKLKPPETKDKAEQTKNHHEIDLTETDVTEHEEEGTLKKTGKKRRQAKHQPAEN